MTNKVTSMTQRDLCDHPECCGLFLFISVRCYWSSLIPSNSSYCCETWMYFVTCRSVIKHHLPPKASDACQIPFLTGHGQRWKLTWSQWSVIIEIPLTFRADFCRCNDFSCPGDICCHILTQMSRKTKKMCAGVWEWVKLYNDNNILLCRWCLFSVSQNVFLVWK